MKELDVLLERFLDARYPAAGDADRDSFRQLLELPDPDLAAYLLTGEPPTDPALARVVAQITRR
jgi:antitoxin CptB